MTTWTAGELRAFLASTADDRFHAAWVLAATTGLRRDALLGLRWADLDLDAGQMSVRRSRVTVGYDRIEPASLAQVTVRPFGDGRRGQRRSKP